MTRQKYSDLLNDRLSHIYKNNLLLTKKGKKYCSEKLFKDFNIVYNFEDDTSIIEAAEEGYKRTILKNKINNF